MTQAENPQELIAQHREAIDALDARILELLNERAGHSLAIRALKPGANMNLYDPEREELIMARLAQLSEGPLQDADIRKIYTPLLQAMREAQAQ